MHRFQPSIKASSSPTPPRNTDLIQRTPNRRLGPPRKLSKLPQRPACRVLMLNESQKCCTLLRSRLDDVRADELRQRRIHLATRIRHLTSVHQNALHNALPRIAKHRVRALLVLTVVVHRLSNWFL